MKVVVLVADSHLDKQAELVQALKKHGITINKVEEKVGIMEGEADNFNYKQIESIPGVSHIRREVEEKAA